VLCSIQAAIAIAWAYLLVLLASARRRRAAGRGATGKCREASFTVLVPAHDEAEDIGVTLDSLRRQTFPRSRYEVVVVADNCTDDTARVARSAGATVLERHDLAHSGKGPALAWAMSVAGRDWLGSDAVAVIDADCEASPNLLEALAERIGRGAAAAQADNVVGNPGESAAAALRFAAFKLENSVRPTGRSGLGLSCGLLGTGMAFSSDLIRELPWEPSSLAEDREYHMRLVEAGGRVEFVPEASVRSKMPASFAASETQQLRWEAGRWATVRRWSPRLVRSGLRARDPVRLHAGLEALIPPQSVLMIATATTGALGLLVGSRGTVRLAGASAGAQAAYVLGGLALVRAPAAAYRALGRAPLLAARNLRVHGRILVGKGPRRWRATERR
jgi:GT2 family glycosyltransferase